MNPNHTNPDHASALQEARYQEFVSLLTKHDQAIRRFIRSLLPSREGSDDVMQETALECWKKFSDFSPDTEAEAVDEFIRWACVVARYKALSWQRNKGRDRLVFRENVIDRLAVEALQTLDRQEDERQAVVACLGRLNEDQQRLVLSVHSPGESIATIAAESGQKARRLYSQLNTLRKLLLDCVQNRLNGEPEHG